MCGTGRAGRAGFETSSTCSLAALRPGRHPARVSLLKTATRRLRCRPFHTREPGMRTLIKNGTCVTASETFIADVWLENGKIAALTQPGTNLGTPDQTVDAKGQ